MCYMTFNKLIPYDLLTPREMDIIRIMYFGMRDTLGLSPEYFNELLKSARKKLGWEFER